MPIIQGCSTISALNNYLLMLKEGRSKSQSFAITLSIARRNIGLCDIDRREAIRRRQLFNKYPK